MLSKFVTDFDYKIFNIKKMSEIKVGQTVWLLEEFRGKQKLKETIVTKVGNKYFWVGISRGKFEIETLMESIDFGYKAKIYLTIKEREEEVQALEITREIRDKIGSYGGCKLSINQLKAIKAIINYPTNNTK